jgi:CHAT domain-containing protein
MSWQQPGGMRAGVRSVEPRLTGGLAWTPFDRNAPLERAHLIQVKEMLHDAHDPHRRGVAYVLAGNVGLAVAALTQATDREPQNAGVWSDLAAAIFMSAEQTKDPATLPRALAAVDRALSLAPLLSEARFNRALILERLGLRTAAIGAWGDVLTIDHQSGWAAEARQHRRALNFAVEDIRVALGRALAARASDQGAALTRLIRSRPQDVRLWGEGWALKTWADTYLCGSPADADRLLTEARYVAVSLRPVSRDRLFSDAIAAIDATALDRRARNRLADAYLSYADGRELYALHRNAPAIASLHRAAEGASGSPIVSLSEYYVANALFDQQRIAESRAMLLQLAAHLSASYPALRAEIDWQLGRTYAYGGQWSAALAYLSRARASFEQLHESQHAAFMDAISAEAFDRVGNIDEGWRRRVSAFGILSHGGSVGESRLFTALGGAVMAEVTRRDYAAALSIAGIVIDRLRSTASPENLVVELTRRARILQDSGNVAAAHSAVIEARRVAMQISDPALHLRTGHEIDVVEALIRRNGDPAGSIALLSSALQYFITTHDRMPVTDLYLGRARTHHAAADDIHALADFEAAMRELDLQRASVDVPELRAGFFDTEPEVFSEAADLLVRRGEVERAFDVVERARARTLAERVHAPRTTIAEIQRRLRPKAVLISYELVPGGLLIFTVRGKSLSVTRVDIEREELRALVDRMQRSIFTAAPISLVRANSAALQKILLEPVRDRIVMAERLYIVPDRFLYDVPFAALYDTNAAQYLVEQHVISVAPSANFCATRAAALATRSPAVVVGDPERDDAAALPGARAEAEAIARLYPGAFLLTGHEATVKNFLDTAPRCALIHYAGHARHTLESGGTMVMAPAADGRDLLTEADIASLHLKRAPLVVLAACGTLRGNSEHIEGMPSIARAFLAAGAQAVAGTLWDVSDDDSARLFRSFHQHLRTSHDSALALAIAQREALVRTRTAARPSVWAAAEILGAP